MRNEVYEPTCSKNQMGGQNHIHADETSPGH